MTVRVCIDGDIRAPEEATISVFDRGFLYGDSIYEVMRTAGGRPVDLDPHLERLAESANRIALDPPAEAGIRQAIDRCLSAAGNSESYVRVIVTRGGGDIGLDTALAGASRAIIIVNELALPPPEQYERGIGLQIVAIQRMSRLAMDPRVKSGNYLNNILALAEAKSAGAQEALMCNAAGRVAEGASSNVFAVIGGSVVTPALAAGLLPGITRRRVIDLLAREGLEVCERELFPDQLRGADEVFITSSIRGVLPARTIDGEALGGGAPGQVTTRVMALYDQFLAESAARAENA